MKVSEVIAAPGYQMKVSEIGAFYRSNTTHTQGLCQWRWGMGQGEGGMFLPHMHECVQYHTFRGHCMLCLYR